MTEHYRNRYREAGWDIFPLKGKHPRVKWSASYRGEWSEADNIGVALGKRSNNLVDLDLDWPEAPDVARGLIGTETTSMFGRQGKRSSHFLFFSEIRKTKKFTLPKSFLSRGVPEEHALTVCELRSNGAYTMFPPSMHPSGERVDFENECEVARVEPDRLCRLAGVIAFTSVCVRFWPGEGARHEAALAFAGVMKWADVPINVTLAIVKAMSEGDREIADRIRAVEDTYARDTTTSKWRKLFEAFAFPDDARPVFADWLALTDHAAVEEYNERYAVIRDGSRVRIGTTKRDPHYNRETWDLMSESDFMLLERKRKEAAIWLQSDARREYPNGFVFDPSGRQHEGYLNLWKGWAVAAEPGDWSLIKAHINEVLADGNAEHGDYIVRWIAWMLQNPDKPAEVALVFRGEKGVGKGVLGRALGKIAGQHGIHLSSSSLMTGRFNAHMRDCVFLFADEALWAGDKEGEGQLKRMTTEDTLVIEGKGRDAVVTPNRLHIMMASNEDWVIPASSDERRFAMFDVSSARRGDHDYFDALTRQISGSGLAAMLKELLSLDLGHWHPRSNVPKTEALRGQIQLSEDPTRSLFRRLLMFGELPGIRPDRNVPNELLFDELRKLIDKEPFGRTLTSAKAGRFLMSIPGVRRNKNGWAFDGLDMETAKPKFKRTMSYLLPPLSSVRQWFDPYEAWDEQADWDFPPPDDGVPM
ncbi:DUF5906 domain-containing protein [Sandarakinorhabdus sp.]|uniref:DUF5906 domain-containing protein n=1 Tax=Sandarakinorhabdus sp. TaxID=1916663 RepID=UPI003F72EAB7